MKVSTDPNYAPQSFLKPDGSYEGFDIDVANELGKRLGVKVEFVTPSWDTITAGNWGGQWDLSVGSMTVTTAREKSLDFVTPYYYTPAQFAASKDSGITSIDQIAGQTVCVGGGTTYESWLKGDLVGLGLPAASIYAQAPANVTVFPLDTDNECAQAIAAGRTEFSVYLTSATVVNSNIANSAPVVKVGKAVYSENLSVAVDKQSAKDPASFVAALDEAIKAMHADGTLTALSTQWFSEDLTLDPTK
jgi:polar amino acid transport system substrate-binding protein